MVSIGEIIKENANTNTSVSTFARLEDDATDNKCRSHVMAIFTSIHKWLNRWRVRVSSNVG